MIGNRDLKKYSEKVDEDYASFLEDFWEFITSIYPRVFTKQTHYAIYDDHIPFLKKGIPITELIDFQYPCWYRIKYALDKCSAQSL